MKLLEEKKTLLIQNQTRTDKNICHSGNDANYEQECQELKDMPSKRNSQGGDSTQIGRKDLAPYM